MPPAARFLATNPEHLPSAPPPEPRTVDSDVVVILAALLCTMVSVAGLALVARCVCPRRSPGGERDPRRPPDKGLRKKALQQLPRASYGGGGGAAAECPICLGEFEEGDQLRVLPQCGHGFHVGCVDGWLGSHSSCPSCRQVVLVAPPPSWCRGCGEGSVDAKAPGAVAREDGDGNRFLP